MFPNNNAATQEKPLDLRIQKTHKSLIEAFLKLLEEKRFENITVNEICDRAMVRRATFYKHFGDKYEFFTFMVQYIQEIFFCNAVPVDSHTPSIEPYITIVKDTLDFLDENETLVHSVMESGVFPLLLNIISEQIVRDVKERFRADAKNGVELMLPPELMAQAYTGALINISRWWVTHKQQASKEDMVEKITKLIKRFRDNDVPM